MSNFVTRAYNTLTVDPYTRSLIKKESSEDRLRSEIEYYFNLPKGLKPFFPKMHECSLKPGEYSMTLEYYAYSNLGEAMIAKNHDSSFWKKVFEFVGTFMKQCDRQPCDRGGTQKWYDDCYDMYISKTEREYSSLVEKFPFFENLRKSEIVILNNEALKPFDTIWPTLRGYIDTHYCDALFSWIHGDCCFSNILYGVNPISGDVILKFIDPRGSFGKTSFYGDPYYDWAKLSHSCNGGYEYFINDEFMLDQVTSNEFWLNKDSDSEMSNFFREVVNNSGLDYRKIRLLEGTIFVGMCARHYDSLERQKAMYLTGLKILNEIYEEILLRP